MKKKSLVVTYLKELHSIGWNSSHLYGSSFDTLNYRYVNPLILGNKSLGPYWVRSSNKKSKTLGNKVLENYNVVLDFKNSELVLEPITDLFPDFSGFGIKLKYKDEQWIIASVITESQAYDFGIRPGQVVLKINEINLADANFDNYCAYYFDEKTLFPGDDIFISVMEADADHEISVELQRENYFIF